MPQNRGFWGEKRVLNPRFEGEFISPAHTITRTRLYPPHVATAVPINRDEGKAATGAMGIGGEGCVPAAWLGWLCHVPGWSLQHVWGDRLPPDLGNAERNVFSPKKWLCSELCCWGRQAPRGGAEREFRWD